MGQHFGKQLSTFDCGRYGTSDGQVLKNTIDQTFHHTLRIRRSRRPAGDDLSYRGDTQGDTSCCGQSQSFCWSCSSWDS
jgi:hypothetical protein